MSSHASLLVVHKYTYQPKVHEGLLFYHLLYQYKDLSKYILPHFLHRVLPIELLFVLRCELREDRGNIYRRDDRCGRASRRARP